MLAVLQPGASVGPAHCWVGTRKRPPGLVVLDADLAVADVLPRGVGRRTPKRSTMITRHRLLKMPPMFQVTPPPHM